MIVSDLVSQINIDSRNVGELEPEEAIAFINQAIDYVNDYLISIKDPTLCKDINITTGMAKPSDWGKSAGTFPFHFNGDTFVADISPGPVKARYFARKPRIASLSDTFPFPDDLSSLVVKWASVFKIKQNEDETTQDERLIAAREARTSVARGV